MEDKEPKDRSPKRQKSSFMLKKIYQPHLGKSFDGKREQQEKSILQNKYEHRTSKRGNVPTPINQDIQSILVDP